MQPTPQDNQLMSKHRVLSLEPKLRLEWRSQDGQNETEQPDHSASLSDSITASTQIRFSVHTADRCAERSGFEPKFQATNDFDRRAIGRHKRLRIDAKLKRGGVASGLRVVQAVAPKGSRSQA
jgi:hypothetical protein